MVCSARGSHLWYWRIRPLGFRGCYRFGLWRYQGSWKIQYVYGWYWLFMTNYCSWNLAWSARAWATYWLLNSAITQRRFWKARSRWIQHLPCFNCSSMPRSSSGFSNFIPAQSHSIRRLQASPEGDQDDYQRTVQKMGRSYQEKAVLPLDSHSRRLQLEHHILGNLPRQVLFCPGACFGFIELWHCCHCCQHLLGMVLRSQVLQPTPTC